MTPTPPPDLPHARPPIDGGAEPFVGNVSVDDNLGECARVALWSALGAFHHGVAVEVRNGIVTLKGALPSVAHRERAVEAVAAIKGVRSVVAELSQALPATALGEGVGLVIGHDSARPTLATTLFCSPDEASVSAAIRAALAQIEQHLAADGKPLPTEVIVGYRNRRPHTLTVDVAAVLEQPYAGHLPVGLHVGQTPHGSYFERPVASGMNALLAAADQLDQLAHVTGQPSSGLLWQSFAAPQCRPWTGHPPATLRLSLMAGTTSH